MSIVTIIMLIFAMAGIVDKIIGNKIGIGKEFDKGIMLLGSLVLTMVGMIVLAPAVAKAMMPLFNVVNGIGIDASLIPATLFANDMGGAALAKEIGDNEFIKLFNAYIVSSMMGCTVSFTIPFAMQTLKKDTRESFFTGTMFGIITVPVGCFVSGLILGIPFVKLIINMIPLALFAVILSLGIVFLPKIMTKVFTVFGYIIRTVITIGLAIGILKFMTKAEIFDVFGDLEEAFMICLVASISLCGAFPFMFIVSKILKKPLQLLGNKLGICNESALGFLSSTVSNIPTIEKFNETPDDKAGIILNSAFCVSASFLIADHLAFTVASDTRYILPMLVGKLLSGIAAVIVGYIYCKKRIAKSTD